MTDNESRTVWAASSGEYSDYSVDCVFENKDDAERYVAAKLADRVEEMTLYASMPTLYTVYTARIAKKTQWGAPVGVLSEASHVDTEEPKHKLNDWDWEIRAEGPDRERVIKSVRDRYAKWKAQQEGVA